MTLEELKVEADKLATEMRSINIRSWGLKPRIHDDWCRRMRQLSDGLSHLKEENDDQLFAKKAPPPPPVKVTPSQL
jgi:hypothetical protein